MVARAEAKRDYGIHTQDKKEAVCIADQLVTPSKFKLPEFRIGQVVEHIGTRLGYIIIGREYIESRGYRYVGIPVKSNEKPERFYFYPIEITE